jgi:hypothetical protein
MESSPPPPPPSIDTTARPSRQELDARFTRAPIGTMCHTLLLTAGPMVAQQVGQAAGHEVVQLLQQCGEAHTDQLGAEQMHGLHQRLSQPGTMQAALAQLETTEQRALLTDIYDGITQRLSQQAVAGTTASAPPDSTAPFQAATSEVPPGISDPTVLPTPPVDQTRTAPKARSGKGKKPKQKAKRKKRGF